MKYLYFK